ncbi:hypothetical protein FGCSD_2102 (plasmid) [Streptococcus dysgalactiae]|nr:hypothetical protein FGCSD_2102 [Streptococcus dysgalactiae]
MNLNQTDLIVSDVPKATQFLASLLNLAVDYADEHFAQFTLGSHCLMVSDHPSNPLRHFMEVSFFILKLTVLTRKLNA